MGTPSIGYFRAIHNSSGLTSEKSRKVEETRARMNADFNSSINVVHDALRNEAQQDFIIVPTKTGCNLIARPGESFDIGDIIYYNTIHWLVTDVNFNDDILRSGAMVRCNRQLRWQNRKTGKIIERWCLATKPYTSNVSEGMSLSTSNREYKIQLSYDEETIQVDLDRRFLLETINGEPKAYQVTSVDTLTNRYQDIDGGFLIWNMKQCEYNAATDNAELMIADYFDPGEQRDEDDTLLRCEITGRSTIRSGSERTYTAVFMDENGDDTTSVVSPIWSVTGDGEVVNADGNSVRIRCNDDAAIGSRIQINLSDADGRYQPSIFYVEVVDLL